MSVIVLTHAQRRSLNGLANCLTGDVKLTQTHALLGEQDCTLTVRHHNRLWLIGEDGRTTRLLPVMGEVA